tara:strand:- start:257 stop:466 length:210 start_codon:yes stop_codon:yes gene_type:complete
MHVLTWLACWVRWRVQVRLATIANAAARKGLTSFVQARIQRASPVARPFVMSQVEGRSQTARSPRALHA